MAIIRLVNGLVDPLQVGTYARSIQSIAGQLGLPSWLVELRHAATHEDLPSLDLLREASRQSMSWLLYNYFLPTINPAPTSQHVSTSIRPLAPVLKLYKNTMKIVTRDVSLMKEYKPRLVNILRDLERWIAECKVSANIASGDVGWTDANADAKEVWALEQLVEVLADRGMMVPLSKKKRQSSGHSQFPSKTNIAIWEPLLRHVQNIHSDFPVVLCRQFISIILQPITTEDTEFNDEPSYYMTIACWVMWAVEAWRNVSSSVDLRKEALMYLLKGMGRIRSIMTSQPIAFNLLKNLTSGQSELDSIIALFSEQQSQIPQPHWRPEDLETMSNRHHLLLQKLSDSHRVPAKLISTETPAHGILAPGWCTSGENTGWKACPIGVYVN